MTPTGECSYGQRAISSYLVAILTLFILGFGFLWHDLIFGVSHSDAWTFFVLALGFLVAFLPIYRPSRSLKRMMSSVAIFAVFSSGILHLRKLDVESPIGRFHRLYWSIRPGMTTSQVEALVQKEFSGVQPSIRWYKAVGFLGLEPVEKNYNAEYIEIRLDKNVVTGTQYLPD